MTCDELDAIEDAYSTKIGPDATTVRVLAKALRELMDEMDAIDFALAGGYVGHEYPRAQTIAELVGEAK